MIIDLIYIATVDDPVPSNSRQLEIKSLWCQMFPNTGFRTGKLSSRVPIAWDCSQNFPKWRDSSGLFTKTFAGIRISPKHWDCSRILRDRSGFVHYRFLTGILQGFFQDCSRILRDCSGIVQFCGMVKIQLDLSQFDPCW